jgi:hypothetical protein
MKEIEFEYRSLSRRTTVSRKQDSKSDLLKELDDTVQTLVDDSTDGRHTAQFLTFTPAGNGKLDVISELILVDVMKDINLEDVWKAGKKS